MRLWQTLQASGGSRMAAPLLQGHVARTVIREPGCVLAMQAAVSSRCVACRHAEPAIWSCAADSGPRGGDGARAVRNPPSPTSPPSNHHRTPAQMPRLRLGAHAYDCAIHDSSWHSTPSGRRPREPAALLHGRSCCVVIWLMCCAAHCGGSVHSPLEQDGRPGCNHHQQQALPQ